MIIIAAIVIGFILGVITVAIVVEITLKKSTSEYKVEPNPREVLNNIFPRLIEMQMYHAILESNASKESSRMLAMKNATDAAKEMGAD